MGYLIATATRLAMAFAQSSLGWSPKATWMISRGMKSQPNGRLQLLAWSAAERESAGSPCWAAY